MRQLKTYKFLLTSVLLSSTLSIATYGIYAIATHHDALAQQAPAQAIPVNTITLAPRDVQLWQEFSGRTRAVDYAEIRPEVSGRIMEIRYKDGDLVKKGDILIVIDPRPYEAALNKSKAQLQAATAAAKLANTEAERAVQMYKNQAITQSQHDTRINEQRMANAQVQAAKADAARAQLDVEYAYVRAPFEGRASRAEITIGNLVQSGMNAPLLTRVVSNQRIYADFDVDEATYLAIASQQTANSKASHPVELELAHATKHHYKGEIANFDNHIDPDSGTIRARATFNNEDGLLIPGMYVTIKLGAASIPNALLIPERAIGTDQNKKYVYVVDDKNKVNYREVVLGGSVQGERIVSSGLKAGEKVIIDGVQHVRPDAIVAPTDAQAKQPATPKA
jgi:multidrug efflux system membrane fusion protein